MPLLAISCKAQTPKLRLPSVLSMPTKTSKKKGDHTLNPIFLAEVTADIARRILLKNTHQSAIDTFHFLSIFLRLITFKNYFVSGI
jgi:hypothetical protein